MSNNKAEITLTPEENLARRALQALYLEVDASIASDIQQKVLNVFRQKDIAMESYANEKFEEGFELACKMAEDYDHLSEHKHRVSDSLRKKRNRLKGELRLTPKRKYSF